MIKIQVIFLFSSYKKLHSDQADKLKRLTAVEYAKAFSCDAADIDVSLCDGSSENNKNDIVIAIDTDCHVMNEGVLRGNFRDALRERMQKQSYLSDLNFTGAIGIQSGCLPLPEVPASAERNTKDTENEVDPLDYHNRAKQYIAEEPRFDFSRLVISENVKSQIIIGIDRIRMEKELFENWGLSAIATPTAALSFYGSPGTGKSMAADAVASLLNKKIIRASYADIENKYVGEGPKNVSAIFLAAEEQDAVLFIDEAESLLSRRLVNVSDPSGQAMNSMRSQLLISLEHFKGIVIFATNLAENYDTAFVSRLINIRFEMPDAELRSRIWHMHLYPDPSAKPGRPVLRIPLDSDVDEIALGEKFELCGREIRNAVVDACTYTLRNNAVHVTQEALCIAAENIVATKKIVNSAVDMNKDNNLSLNTRRIIAQAMDKKSEDEEKAKNQQ